MVTTRHSSYMPGQADTGSTTSTPARSSKRKTQDAEDHTSAEKKRKVDNDNPEASSAKTKTATRIRFGSEEVQSPAPVPDTVPVVADSEADDGDESLEEEDSDDEAPEDISTSVAQKGAEADALAAEKAIQLQQAADKRKRQEKSTRLEKQAQANKHKTAKSEAQPAKPSVDELPPSAGPGSDEDDDVDTEGDEDDGPDLLPADLLETDFTRPPTPPPTGTSDKIALPSKVIKLDNEPPRDRKVGNVTVSVLPKANDLLPPKASAESRKLREHWLAGRRKVGKKGAVAVERRSFGGGFVKKR